MTHAEAMVYAAAYVASFGRPARGITADSVQREAACEAYVSVMALREGLAYPQHEAMLAEFKAFGEERRK